MQNIRIKLDVDQWNNACKYLKDPSAGLDVAEESAIEQLSDFWRTQPFSKDLSNDCAELIDALKKNLKLYSSNNRKTTEQLQNYIGIAKKIYCTDKATYEEYVQALRELHHVRKTPKPTTAPTPQKKTTVAPTPPVKCELKIISVDFYDSDGDKNKYGLTLPTTVHYICPRVKYSITPAPKTPIKVSYRIFSPSGKMLELGDDPEGFLDSQVLTSREGTIMFSGWGSTSGTIYYEGRWRFELYSESKLINTTFFNIKSPFSKNPPSIDVQKVEFANTDYDGSILNDYGIRLPLNTRYLTPRVFYTIRNKENREIELRYTIYDPNGTLQKNKERNDRYIASNKINLAQDSPVRLTGFGNREGNSYMPGVYKVEIYEGDYLLYTTSVTIGIPQVSPKPTYTPPPAPVYTSTEKDPYTKGGCFATLGLTALVIAVIFGLMKWCRGDDPNNPEGDPYRYVMASQVFLRSSPSAASNSNIITKVPYGTRLSYVGEYDGWLEVTESESGNKGYVAEGYALDTKEFNHLDSIWGDPGVRTDIDKTRYRQALLNLYHELKPNMGDSYFILEGPGDNWMEKNLKDGYDNYPEFAFIVKDTGTGNRKAVIYSFLQDESPLLRHIEDAPDNGGIKNISYKTSKGYTISYGSGKSQSKKDRNVSNELDQQTDIPAKDTQYKPQEDNDVRGEVIQHSSTTSATDNTIYNVADKQAEFPGGMSALMKWLSANIHYPESAQKSGKQGRVVVKFIIEKDGSVSSPSVEYGIDKELDREALRVVGKMPKWTPGKIDGVAVRSYFILPVSFRLREE